MRIVAVCALHHPLFNFVVEERGKLRLDVAVAMKAELGILHLKQMLRRAGRVDAVAANAADVSLVVDRVFKVCVPGFMASLAFFIHLLGGSSGGVGDHPGTAGLRVRLAGAVTAPAGHAFAAVH